MKKTDSILKKLNECINHIKKEYGINLTVWNLWEFIKHFKDNPKGLIENEIDSFTIEFDTDEIENALLTLPEVNIS